MVVAGAGPAGSTAAKILAEDGLSVLLVEKSGPPRDKVCGGLLSKVCMDLVRRIQGSDPPSDVRREPERLEIFLIPPSGVANGFKVSGEWLMSIRRRGFDAWLAGSAENAGAEILRDGEVVSFNETGEAIKVLLNTKDGGATATARYLVGADGIYSRIRDKMSLRSIEQRVIYAQEYYRRPGGMDDCFYMIYSGEVSPTYSYAIPADDQLCLGAGVLNSRTPTLRDGMARLRALFVKDFGLQPGTPSRSEGFSAPFGGIHIGKGRVFLVGDAAGFSNPLTGEGIAYAVGSGEAAALAVRAGGADPQMVYAAAMRVIVDESEALVRRTMAMDDEEREERVAARRPQSSTASSRSEPGRTASP